MNKKVAKFNKKYPFFEPIITFLFGGVGGFFINNLCTDFIKDWRFWLSKYFLGFIIVIILVFTYYSKYSIYSPNIKKSKLSNSKVKFDEKLLAMATEMISKGESIDKLVESGSKITEYIDRVD